MLTSTAVRVRGAVAAAFVAVAALTGVSATATASASSATAVVAEDVCAANDNLGEIATNFISRCRKGSIRSVFPGQHYGDTLGYIKGCGDASCKTAWKLLNDNRFKK
ncbi:hypothetical protein [Streptomyces sp. CBMA152]|uniref:hypothetical protein n=1 Tax=Streptomyces sp. CBMA152 TaxID=1896312 RepID=UPI001660BF8E|nr:hypothetical protein [Streptomyces sp. CBMA152]MBD0743172.1 hypothetical protein [Streptomyces sp. CBMA152]